MNKTRFPPNCDTASLGGVTIFFLGMVTLNREEKPYFSWSLFRSDLLYRIMRARPFQFAVQAPFVILLFLIIAAGLFGNPLPNRNIAPVLAWTLWWALIIFDIVFLGRMWCLICPWDALASPVQRLTLWKRKEKLFNLGISWPSWLKNVHMATFLFILLTWLELGYGITQSPMGTAVLGILMTVLAVGFAVIFNKKAFCQYGCLIGRICGIYSMSSPLELRKIDADTCRMCKGKDCYTGNDRGYPCPTNQLMEKMDANTYCTLCTECIKSCPHENISLNIRSFGADLLHFGKARHDEAIMALVMLSLSSFHGLTMTPIWIDFTDWIMKNTGWRYLSAFSLGMAGIILLPFLLYTVVVRTSKYLAGRDIQIFNHFAYPLVTIALFYHLAHNTGHILGEGLNIIPVLSDPLGRGWDLFGTALWKPLSHIDGDACLVGPVGDDRYRTFLCLPRAGQNCQEAENQAKGRYPHFHFYNNLYSIQPLAPDTAHADAHRYVADQQTPDIRLNSIYGQIVIGYDIIRFLYLGWDK